MPAPSAPPPQEVQALLALFSQGQWVQAAQLAQRLAQRYPEVGFFWKAQGAALMQTGQTAQALAPLEQAARLMPQDPESHNNLGAALRAQGQAAQALACYQRALALQPQFVQAQRNLGNTLRDLGRDLEAASAYARLLELQADDDEAQEQLAYLHFAHGQHAQALALLQRRLLRPASEAVQQLFVDCLKYLVQPPTDVGLQVLLTRAFTEAWGRPNDLMPAALALVCREAPVAELADDSLLCAALQSAPVCTPAAERWLTQARCNLLQAQAQAQAAGAAAAPPPALRTRDSADASDDTGGTAPAIDQPVAPAGLAFYAALACQCFINEYVFALQPREQALVDGLRVQLSGALSAQQPVSPLALLALACYQPLGDWPPAQTLLAQAWPPALQAVLRQQVREPLAERAARSQLERLTPIDDTVSREVRAQYEQSPYPRWVRLPHARSPLDVNQTLAQLFAHSGLRPLASGAHARILVAGCGTGQHPIDTALRFAHSRVLAVDLSLSSLAYAQRKAQEMGLAQIHFAQADILRLGALQERFAVIESSGVLHHLADWRAGWRVLLGLLQPGGVMKIGLYSAAARRDIVRIRTQIAERGYEATPEGIRQCRQDLLHAPDPSAWGRVLRSVDFYSTSNCRDLLFHVQESHTTLAEIASFLQQHGLRFLGFELDPHILRAYRAHYPQDPAATDLALWQALEQSQPDLFFNMYQFWVQQGE